MPQRTLVVECFGGPSLRSGPDEIALSTQQRNLLALIAAAPEPRVSRFDLTTLLWPDGTDDLLRRRLNQLVYSLNRKVGEARLLAGTPQAIGLVGTDAQRDRDRLLAELESGELSEVVRLLERGFLTRVVAPPTVEFETWIERREVELRSFVRERATRRWSDADQRGDRTEMIGAARILFAVDPDEETALRRYIGSLAAAGRFDEAEAVFHSFCNEQASARETGSWSPSPETRALVEQLRTLPVPGAELFEDPPSQPPLVGRPEELQVLRGAIRQPAEATARVVLVTGEGGMGKTRLVREALLEAPAAGARTLMGYGGELERAIPLNGLLQALADPDVEDVVHAMEEPWKSVILGLLPEFHRDAGPVPEPPEIQPGQVPRRMFEALLRLVQAISQRRPLILFLDDLQWSDETSLVALDYIRRRWSSGSLLLILSLRPEGVSPGSTLARFVGDLENDRATRIVRVEELDPESADSLIRAVGSGKLSGSDRKTIARLGGHSPFFLIELTLEWVAGRLRAPEDEDEGLHEGLLRLPLSIRQLLDQRLQEVPPKLRSLLELLAVYGRPIPLGDLPRLTSLCRADIADQLSLLHRLHLVGDTEVAIGLRHDLVRQEVYRRLDPLKKTLLHKHVATYLLEPKQRGPVGQLAVHFDRAGERERALTFSLEAAEKAEMSGAVREAMQYLRIAQRSTTDSATRAGITQRLGILHYLERDFGKASALLQLASERLREGGRIADALSAEVKRLDALSHSGALSVDECLAELSRVKRGARAGCHSAVVVEALEAEVRLLDRIGAVAKVRAALREAEGLSKAGGPEVESAALCILTLHSLHGSPERAIRAARRAVAVARKHRFNDLWLKAINRQILVMINQGTLASAEGKQLFLDASRLAAGSGDLWSRFHPEHNLGVWHLRCYEFDRAKECFDRAERLIDGTEAPLARLYITSNRGILFARSGRLDDALEAFETAKRLLRDSSLQYLRDYVYAGIGLCALNNAQLKRALEYEAKLSPDPSHWYFDPSPLIEFRARMLLARGRQKAALQLITRVASEIEDRLVTAWLNLKLVECRIRARLSREAAAQAAVAPLAVAQNLGLIKIAGVLERFQVDA